MGHAPWYIVVITVPQYCSCTCVYPDHDLMLKTKTVGITCYLSPVRQGERGSNQSGSTRGISRRTEFHFPGSGWWQNREVARQKKR